MLKAILPGLLALLAGCAAGEGNGPAQYPALPPADIYLLGEVHDNAAHHRVQAIYLQRLKPAAVVFEMLTPEQAATVNRGDARGSGLAEALGWADSGWPDWKLYEPVFDALDTVPVYGMALPRATVRQAVSEGAAAVFGDEAATFGLDRPLPVSQREQREAEQLAAHCNKLPVAMLGGMVEAQRLRDAAFARTALRALSDTGGPVVVITGSGHARRDWGMPAAISMRAPAVSVFSLGQLEGEPETPPPFDLWLSAAPAPREDPCAVFD